MKVLQLCLRVPYPPNDGGTIAMFNMAESLRNAGATIKILSFNTKKHFVDPASLPDEFVKNYNPEMVYLDASVRLSGAILNLFSKKSYNISRFDISLFHNQLKEILCKEQFDLILLESLFVAPYLQTIRRYSQAKLVLRSHNVEYLIWERLAESSPNIFRKAYLSFLSRRLKKYESSVINKFDGVICLTHQDKILYNKLGCNIPTFISPIGVDNSKYIDAKKSNSSPSLFHLASMDWLPNIEAVDWFINKVYPLLNSKNIKIRIYFAGKNMPDKFIRFSNDQLVITGRVEDSAKFIEDKQIMIVPLLSGGGMRVKIIEGMAMGKVVISTSIGAEGIQYTHGENILIADTPEQFCDAIIQCLNNSDLRNAISKNAILLARNSYDNKILGNHILDFYKKIISTSQK